LLSSYESAVSSKTILDTISLSPLERLEAISERHPFSSENIQKMTELYAWFLEKTGYRREIVLDWIDDKKNRTEAFAKGREFANEMFNVYCKVTANTDKMRYLVL